MNAMEQVGEQIETENSVSDESPPKDWFGARHTQVLLLFLLCTLVFGTVNILSIGIVAMTDPLANPDSTIPTYNWTNKGVILSSFFWGYSIPQIGVGPLIKLYKPKWLLTGSAFIASLSCILIPCMAKIGSAGVILCRVVQGLSTAFFYPCCHEILAKWIPQNERSRMGTFAYSGISLGSVLATTVTGWISGSPIGWPFSFYSLGTIAIMWIMLWLFVGKNSPADHPNINELERKYIETSLGQQTENVERVIPWKAIVTSLPVWAIFISSIGECWGLASLTMSIPLYMENVLNYNIKSTGLLSSGPYLLFWLLSFFFATVADYVISKHTVSITMTRKIANSIGFYVPAVALLALAIISRSENDLTVNGFVIFCIAGGVSSCSFSGFMVNHIDLSPNYAGLIMGITNGLGSMFSIAALLIVQYVVTDETNRLQWAIVFYIIAGVYIFCNTFFILFASGKVQPWNSG